MIKFDPSLCHVDCNVGKKNEYACVDKVVHEVGFYFERTVFDARPIAYKINLF